MGYIQNVARAGKQFLRTVASATGKPAYESASTGRRMGNWLPDSGGPNATLFGNLELIRSRARDLARQNAWAAGALDSFVANAIGTGIKPQVDDKLWLKWTDECDADGLTDFYGLESQICRAVMQDGEVFVRLRRRLPVDGLSVPLQLQVIEADFVPVFKNEMLANGGKVRGGIEINAIGQRVAYHMYAEHPGEGLFGFSTDQQIKRVPASEVLHIFRPLRPGQLRGLPWFSPAMVTLWELDKFVDATLQRQQLCNLLSLFIKKSPDTPGPFNEEDQGDGTATATLEPGITHYLQDGEEPWTNDPPDPGANYTDFVKSMLHAIARALGIPYHSLSGSLEDVNYSSIRAGLLEFRRWCEAFQHQVMVFQFCRPVRQAWLEQGVLAGVITASQLRREDKEPVVWTPQAWPWVDPLKDGLANELAVRNGFTSRSKVVAERGEDSKAIDAEQASDNQRADDAKLKYDSDGRAEGGGKAFTFGDEATDTGTAKTKPAKKNQAVQ